MAGFVCLGTDPVVCTGRVPAYPNDVAVVVPAEFHSRPRADVILYLHGNNASNRTLAQYLSDFQLPQALKASGRDAIMVVPLSVGPVTQQHEAALGPAAGYRAFLTQILDRARQGGLVSEVEPDSITLAGHSGAYRGLSLIASNGVWADRTRELYLIDSIYAAKDSFLNFAKDPSHRLWHVTTPHGGTQVQASCLQLRLKAAGLGYFGCEIYSAACGSAPAVNVSCRPPTDVGPTDWDSTRLGFLYTPVAHDAAVPQWLPRFLAPGAHIH
ncbi:MAG TPA: hypothetical protein VL588_10085 [Bdellovibrionota bacterium]|nr:hypothetical protein [Bdellovibrionota bacterium]